MYEKITGDRVVGVLQRLMQNQNPVKVSLRGSEYEGFVALTEIQGNNMEPVVHIDPPEGLLAAIQQCQCTWLRFEFQDTDLTPLHFEALIKEIRPNAVRLAFPVCIQRFQMRGNFRIEPARTSHARLTHADQKIELIVQNVSLGGMFCYCPSKFKALFEKKPSVNQLDLIIKSRRNSFDFTFQKANVERLEPCLQPGYFGVAIEFVQMTLETKKCLVRAIYDLQREFLKNRLPL